MASKKFRLTECFDLQDVLFKLLKPAYELFLHDAFNVKAFNPNQSGVIGAQSDKNDHNFDA